MRIIDERCCGLDVHNKSIMACWLTPDERAGTRQQVRRFGTMTRDLLDSQTGSQEMVSPTLPWKAVYWKPVGNILEAICTILLVYAQVVKWFREGRPIPKIVHGSQTCCSTGYGEVVLFPPPLCGN